MSIRADYHIHSCISPDGRHSIEEIAEKAIAYGLSEIAITDHFEFFDPESNIHQSWSKEYLDHYFEQLQFFQERFQGRLIIRKGIEIGQPFIHQVYANEIMKQYHFDYVIGSVHKINDCDLGRVNYLEISIDELIRENLSSLMTLSQYSDFDCIGHLDLIKRYAAQKGVYISLLDYQEEVEVILKNLISREKGLEINTSGLRQTVKQILPSIEIIKRFCQLGGKVLTVGSDAHRKDDVAKDFQVAQMLLEEIGVSYIATFENRKPHFYKI